MNPYASQLGNRDPIEVVAATPAQLKRVFDTLGPAGMKESVAPGKWSSRQILCHLADCELVFSFRLRQTLAEDRHVIQPFDQDKWANTYGAYEAGEALALFAAARRWNVKLVRAASPAMLSKAVNHPERGEMTFKTIVETMAGHDLNHLQQLETIAARFAPGGKRSSFSTSN
jgi:DinB superfamily